MEPKPRQGGCVRAAKAPAAYYPSGYPPLQNVPLEPGQNVPGTFYKTITVIEYLFILRKLYHGTTWLVVLCRTSSPGITLSSLLTTKREEFLPSLSSFLPTLPARAVSVATTLSKAGHGYVSLSLSDRHFYRYLRQWHEPVTSCMAARDVARHKRLSW